jgi:hypothetical protein
MRHLNKKLVATAATTALMAALGVAVAQSSDNTVDPMATPQQAVDVNAEATGEHIYFFRDQGNSPETDPAAHLMLIKHDQWRPVPVAESTTTTTTKTVAETTPPADAVTTAMPAASDTSNTETSTDTIVAPVETAPAPAPALAPKADRN